MHDLILNIWFLWKCEYCDKKQEPVENEEWPMCCDHGMKYQAYKKFSLDAEAPSEKGN